MLPYSRTILAASLLVALIGAPWLYLVFGGGGALPLDTRAPELKDFRMDAVSRDIAETFDAAVAVFHEQIDTQPGSDIEEKPGQPDQEPDRPREFARNSKNIPALAMQGIHHIAFENLPRNSILNPRDVRISRYALAGIQRLHQLYYGHSFDVHAMFYDAKHEVGLRLIESGDLEGIPLPPVPYAELEKKFPPVSEQTLAAITAATGTPVTAADFAVEDLVRPEFVDYVDHALINQGGRQFRLDVQSVPRLRYMLEYVRFLGQEYLRNLCAVLVADGALTPQEAATLLKR